MCHWLRSVTSSSHSRLQRFGIGIVVYRLAQESPASTLLMNPYGTSIGADKGDCEVTHKTVLEVDEEVLEVIG